MLLLRLTVGVGGGRAVLLLLLRRRLAVALVGRGRAEAAAGWTTLGRRERAGLLRGRRSVLLLRGRAVAAGARLGREVGHLVDGHGATEGVDPALTLAGRRVTLLRGRRTVLLLRGRRTVLLLRGRRTVLLLRGRRTVLLLRGRRTVLLLRGRRSVLLLGRRSVPAGGGRARRTQRRAGRGSHAEAGRRYPDDGAGEARVHRLGGRHGPRGTRRSTRRRGGG